MTGMKVGRGWNINEGLLSRPGLTSRPMTWDRNLQIQKHLSRSQTCSCLFNLSSYFGPWLFYFCLLFICQFHRLLHQDIASFNTTQSHLEICCFFINHNQLLFLQQIFYLCCSCGDRFLKCYFLLLSLLWQQAKPPDSTNKVLVCQKDNCKLKSADQLNSIYLGSTARLHTWMSLLRDWVNVLFWFHPEATFHLSDPISNAPFHLVVHSDCVCWVFVDLHRKWCEEISE